VSKKRYISKTEGSFLFLRQILLHIKDENIPLDKKLKFVKMFLDKLNEFVSKKTSDDKKFKNFRKLYKKLLKIDKEFLNIYEEELIPAFEKEKIYIGNLNSLNEDQLKSGNEFFDKNIKTVLTPFAINEDSIQSFFKDGQKYFVLKIESTENDINTESKISSENDEEVKYEYVLIEVPSSIPKFINPSSEITEIISVIDIIELNLQKILPERKIKDIYSFILRLNNEANNEWMLFTGNGNLPKEIRKLFSIKKKNVFTELFYPQVLDLTSFLGNKFSLRENGVKTLTGNVLSKMSNIFEIISKQDILFYFPYHSNENILNLFQQVSNDPFVTEIKLTQSPLTHNPNIIVSLMNAVKNGKRVNIYADENSDVNPLNDFRESGINIILNASGLQIDSETALIKRRENEGEKNYIYFSTKNLSEKNSYVTDIGLLTSDEVLSTDLNYFFNFLELGTKGFEFDELLVSSLNIKKSLVNLIENEARNAEKGKDAFIMLKMNKLEDKKLIDLISDASAAGVKIKLLVSENCLLENEHRLNQNIQIKYLISTIQEHSRIFVFYNDGEPVIYISSIDWTEEDFSRKVGLALPVKQISLRTTLIEMINLYSKNDLPAIYNYLKTEV
jgi:polyphosphate kinase